MRRGWHWMSTMSHHETDEEEDGFSYEIDDD